ncbi:NUDIX domain-containing protein [Haladaptatus litoreus]|uniref:NUDIX domain-containing protein n=1 Tax=Haladaptatus litoreus TaxID=553468 RepID=A0A1N6YQ22_9EURY|nr:NUDIX hydrolase [Haladaptatus litoreus]SIR16743.1 NUDIX domain-containing protein [Haladaptatus litoreus]
MSRLADIRRRDDVREGKRTFSLPTENFATVVEIIESGYDQWVGAVVTDDDGRVLLVENGWSGGWIIPGGTVETNETPAEAVVREIEEETGVSVELDRPLLVERQRFTHADEDEIAGDFVLFGATASDTEIGDDLGVEDETIYEARWFADVPAMKIDYSAEIESFRE